MKSSLVLFVLFAAQAFAQTVSLHDTTNRYDYIIITTPEYTSTCAAFKTHKESVRNLDVLVVDTSQIFAEFNSSQKPEENIREFISYAGTYWTDPAPKYFLLAGTQEMVPNFRYGRAMDTIWTDYFYSQSLHDPDSSISEFYIGRVPARTNSELQNYFNKVINYETGNSMQSWDYNSLFYHDVDDYFQFDEFAYELSELLPQPLSKKFITTAPGNKDSLFSYLNNTGSASVWFIGKGYGNLFGEDSLSVSDLEQLSNGNKYFISFFVSCHIDETGYSLSDKMILEEEGAVASFLSKGIVFWGAAREILSTVADNLYEDLTTGEIIYKKVLTPSSQLGTDSKIGYHLWGDPSLKIKSDNTLDVKNNSEINTDNYHLGQNYPNPFNPATKISFTIPQAGNVELKVYDVLGNEIALLTNNIYSAGRHTVDFNASSLSSGIYFYTMKSGSVVQSKKMLLMK